MKFALAGNPNSGKTTLFNGLTKSTAHTGNWPGVTVERREGVYKTNKQNVIIVDLPGIYSLSPYTSEEVISRNFIIDSKPDCIIDIVDATNIERNLYLTTQLMETQTPVVVALNMMDEVEKNGDIIDVDKLSMQLGIPVVKISAIKGTGLKQLMDVAIAEAEKKREQTSVLNSTYLKPVIDELETLYDGHNSLFYAIKSLEGEASPKAQAVIDKYNNIKKPDEDFEAIVADLRFKFITGIVKQSVQKKHQDLTKSDKIDKVMTHKIWGIPIFLVVLFAIFHITFSENFLFIGGLISDDWVSLAGTPFEGLFGEGAIIAPGVVLQTLMGIFTDWIGGGIASLLKSFSPWVSGLIVDGVWGGIASVLSFVPQILLLLLLFAILEDTGYMARIAFILDRMLKKFGLSGRAFMPMIMGFGCSIPAMVNTRTLADDKERIATIRVIPFFSCGAKLPILTAVAGAIAQFFGVGNADVITYSMYLLGIVTAIITVILMKNTTLKGESAPFIMELPTYRAPQFKSLMLLLWDKAKHFIKKAFTIIMGSTILIWFISHFDFTWHMLPDEEMDKSILGGLGMLLQPIFTPLGFGSQLGKWGWVFVVAAVTGLIAKENVIATFGVLASCILAASGAAGGFEATDEGINEVVAMINATGITIPGLISFIAFNMLTIPCFAAVATAKAELTRSSYHWTLLFWLATSYIGSTLVYTMGKWWWTSLIIIPALIAIIVLLYLKNSGKLTKVSKK